MRAEKEKKRLNKNGTVSIIRKINRSIQWNRLGKMIGWDFVFWMTGVIGTALAVEYHYGEFALVRTRRFSMDFSYSIWRQLQSLEYVVEVEGAAFPVALGRIMTEAAVVVGVIFCVQLLGWLMNWPIQNGKLRAFMRPIDELALTAEQLSMQGIDEARLQNLEEAIDQMSEMESSISIGDQDLMGLETAINNMLKRLQASYREQTRFVDDASHELRTPIAVIQGYTSMLLRWGMDDRQVLEEAVEAISEESKHMKELVEQLLFLARGDGGRQQFKEKQVDAGELLEEICEESEMIDRAHVYQLDKRCPAQILADPAMMKQAVRILVDNAAKYTPQGGNITLRLERNEKGEIGLGVQDEGIGLDRQEAAHMFERFFRGEEVRGNTKGSGLGLSIAKWIADRHHGRIEVLSYKEIGTRITIYVKEYPKDAQNQNKEGNRRD